MNYDPARNSRGCWETGIAAGREKLIRAGKELPTNDRERAWAEEGPVPADRLASVIDPPHYRAGGVEAIDVIEAFGLNYRLGNVAKYLLRAGRKGDALTDLRKARWYLDREIDAISIAPPVAPPTHADYCGWHEDHRLADCTCGRVP